MSSRGARKFIRNILINVGVLRGVRKSIVGASQAFLNFSQSLAHSSLCLETGHPQRKKSVEFCCPEAIPQSVGDDAVTTEKIGICSLIMPMRKDVPLANYKANNFHKKYALYHPLVLSEKELQIIVLCNWHREVICDVHPSSLWNDWLHFVLKVGAKVREVWSKKRELSFRQ